MRSRRRESELNRLLLQCEQLYSELPPILMDPSPSPDLSGISRESMQRAAALIDRILTNVDEIQKQLRETKSEGFQAISSRSREFYRQKLVPNRQQWSDLLPNLLEHGEMEIDPADVRSLAGVDPVWRILCSGLDFWQQEPGSFPQVDLDAAEHLLYESFFRPDEWLRNADELEPVLGELADRRIPRSIRIRLRELYRSFSLGNYLAVIALARAVLEYALIDRASDLGIQTGRRRPLKDLIDEAAERVPVLGPMMESIRDTGNQTLHPSPNDQLVLLESALRSLSLSSINALRSVLERLYLA